MKSQSEHSHTRDMSALLCCRSGRGTYVMNIYQSMAGCHARARAAQMN